MGRTTRVQIYASLSLASRTVHYWTGLIQRLNGPMKSQWDYGLEGLTEDLTGCCAATEKGGGAKHDYFAALQQQ